MIAFFIFLILSDQVSAAAAEQDECQPTSCNGLPPFVRFPFRLKGRQPERCGYPGFDLACRSDNTTAMEFQVSALASSRRISFPISANATVESIDYKAQVIRIQALSSSCLPSRVPDASVSTPSPFDVHYPYGGPSGYFYTLFNCSPKPDRLSWTPVTCLDSGAFRVIAAGSTDSVRELWSGSCFKMYDVSGISDSFFWGNTADTDIGTEMHWSVPSCGSCEEQSMHCRLMSNGTVDQTECFGKPIPLPPRKVGGNPKKVVIAVVIPSVFLIATAVAVMGRIYIVKTRKRHHLRRIRQFLEDYEALRPTRYQYSDVKRITDGFKHRLGQGGYGTVYKGKLSNDVLVAVKVLKNSKGNGEEFLNEVGTLGKIHHVNVVRLVGYCADGYRRALVYEFLEKDSLEKYISSNNHRRKIGWEKMREIAIGVAKGLDYLHQGCNQRILHFDIKPHNILLDQNLNPKVADFGLAKLCSKDKSVVTMTAARGTIGYIAPEVFSRNFGKVSYKSDIYSFGMLLIDMVGGRENFRAGAQDDSEIYFPEWMYNQLDKGEDIAIQIENEGDSSIVKRLIIVGLWCIQWYPADRPSMKVVIRMLEEETMPLMPPNPFAATTAAHNDATSSGEGFDCLMLSQVTDRMP